MKSDETTDDRVWIENDFGYTVVLRVNGIFIKETIDVDKPPACYETINELVQRHFGVRVPSSYTIQVHEDNHTNPRTYIGMATLYSPNRRVHSVGVAISNPTKASANVGAYADAVNFFLIEHLQKLEKSLT